MESFNYVICHIVSTLSMQRFIKANQTTFNEIMSLQPSGQFCRGNTHFLGSSLDSNDCELYSIALACSYGSFHFSTKYNDHAFSNPAIKLELLAEDDAAEGHPEDLDVEPPGAVLEVEEVVLETAEHLFDGVGVTVVVGGVGGDSRTDLVEIGVARVTLHDLVDEELALRTRTHECHVAAEDVPELRKFIEMVGADETADLCKTRVLVTSEKGRTAGLGVGAHRAELVDVERTAETAYALLAVDCRASVLDLDGKPDDKEQRRENNQTAG